VFLPYKLDEDAAKTNPLIKNGCEVVNNYLHKWNGSSPQYNLGGLCYNLSKSFEAYPPLGEDPAAKAAKEAAKAKPGVFSSITSLAGKAIDTVGEGLYSLTHSKQVEESKKEEDAALAAVLAGESKDRQEKIEKLTQKLKEKFATLDAYFEEGKTTVDICDNHMVKAKQVLDENGMKLKKEILVLESEK